MISRRPSVSSHSRLTGECWIWISFQAPATMKSCVQAAWLMTVAIGNLIIVVIAEARFFASQVCNCERGILALKISWSALMFYAEVSCKWWFLHLLQSARYFLKGQPIGIASTTGFRWEYPPRALSPFSCIACRTHSSTARWAHSGWVDVTHCAWKVDLAIMPNEKCITGEVLRNKL